VDGVGLHFTHVKGKGDNPIPLLLVHGWPDSFARFLKIIPMLTNPAEHGADLQPSFDVILPSLPGFGFSDRPKQRGLTFSFGDLLRKLMVEELGYPRFAVHGGDWGSTVAEHMARSHSESLVGIHLTDVPFFHMFQEPNDLSRAEAVYLKKMEEFPQKEGSYALIQSTRPQTLACGLNDSPAGLAAWSVEKFRGWSDCDGDLERCFSRDEMLNNIMIYWVIQTIDSSFFPYYDLANAGPLRWISEAVKTWLGSTGGSGRIRALSERFRGPAAGMGRTLLQRSALDRNAARWSFCCNGTTRALGSRTSLYVQSVERRRSYT